MAIVRIQLRHDTKDNWYNVNPLLASGEAGVETDTGRIKIGDGLRYWRQLSYSSGQLSDNAPNPVSVSPSAGTSSEAARADHQHALPNAITVQNATISNNALVGGSLSVAGPLVGGSHNHNIDDINNLNATLLTYAKDGHSHQVSNITDFPTQADQDGKYLTTDGTNLYWQNVTGGSSSAGITKVNAGSGVVVTEDNQDSTNITVALADSSVASVNSKSGDITLAAGSNVQITESGNNITISATTSSSGTAGVSSVEGIAGAVNIVDGANITTSVSGQDLTISVDTHNHTHSQITDFGDGVNASIAVVEGEGLIKTYNTTTDVVSLTLEEQDRVIDPPPPVDPEPEPDPADPEAPLIVITEDVPDLIPVVSSAAEIEVVMRNDDGASYQWQKADDGSSVYSDLSSSSMHSGVTTKKLTIQGLTVADDKRRYRLKITKSDGEVQFTNSGVINTQTLEIVTHPQGIELIDGTSLALQDRMYIDYRGSRTGKIYYKWVLYQAPANTTYAFNLNGDPQRENRGVLGQVLYNGFAGGRELSGTNGRIYAPLITQSSYNWIESNYGVNSGQISSGYLYCEIVEDIDTFTGQPATGYQSLKSEYGRIQIVPGTPDIVTEPQNTAMSATNTASFSVTYEYGAPVVWQRRDLDGTTKFVDLTHEPGEQPINTEVKSLTGTGNQVRSTLTLTDLENYTDPNRTGDIGVMFRAIIGTGDVAPQKYSAWASLTGTPPTITQNPTHLGSGAMISGSTTQIQARYSPISGTAQWQYLPPGWTGSWVDYTSGSVITSGGVTTLTTGVLSTGQDQTQFRVKITGAGTGAGSVTSSAVTIGVVSSVSPGDSVFTQQLTDQTVYEGGSYSGHATSNLLNGTGAQNHYAVAIVEYDDGVKEVRALQNGTHGFNGASSPLKFFPAGAYTKYEVNISGIRAPATVKIAAATDPFQLALVGGSYQSSPFRRRTEFGGYFGYTGTIRMAGNGAIASQTLKRHRLFARTGDAEVDNADVSITFPYPLIGFSVSQTARVTIIPQRAALAPAMAEGDAGPFAAPESYFFLGAANNHNEVICVPRGAEYNTFIYSTNEGLDYRTFFFPRRIQACAVLYWKNKWWVFGRINGVFKVFRCNRGSHSNPNAWQEMAAHFGTPDGYSLQSQSDFNSMNNTRAYSRMGLSASVVNDNLYVAVSRVNTGANRIARPYLNYLFKLGTAFANQASTQPAHLGAKIFESLVPFGHTYRITTSGGSLISGYNQSTTSGNSWSMLVENPNHIFGWSSSSYHHMSHPIAFPVSVEGQNQQYTLIGGWNTHFSNRYSNSYWGGNGFGFAPQLSQGGISSATSSLSSLSQHFMVGGHSHTFGPQIGNTIYGVGLNGAGHYCILKFNAYFPQQATALVTLPNYGVYSPSVTMHGTGSSGTIDNTTVNTTSVRRLHGLNKTGFNVATASDILRGSYRYGNQDQLDDMYLDGTNSCGNGAIVFTKNHALVMYRYYIHAATINVQTYNNYTTSSSYLNPSRPNSWWTFAPTIRGRVAPSAPPTMR